MITYGKVGWGIPLLFRMYGSALPRALPFSSLSSGICAVLYFTIHDLEAQWWRHPYPYQSFAVILGFIIIFRTNYGYQRFWEGRTYLQKMTACWVDAFVQHIIFDAYNHEGKGQEADEAHDRFRAQLTHLYSLVHAMAVQHLRTDWDLFNIQPHSTARGPPPQDAAALRGRIIQGPVFGMTYKGRFSPWDLFMLRGSNGMRTSYNKALPLMVVGGLSEAEGAALGMHQYGKGYLETATLFGGVDRAGPQGRLMQFLGLTTGMYVPGAAERTITVYTWIQQILQARMAEGGLQIAPPIMANAYKSLSDGYQAFQGCRILADTPFPFPWAQLVLTLLLFYALTVPFLVVAFVRAPWLGILINFMCVQTYWAMNEVARDLEDPFVYEPNDLPLARFQYQYNQRLVAAARAQLPSTSPCPGFAYDARGEEAAACAPAGVSVVHQPAPEQNGPDHSRQDGGGSAPYPDPRFGGSDGVASLRRGPNHLMPTGPGPNHPYEPPDFCEYPPALRQDEAALLKLSDGSTVDFAAGHGVQVDSSGC